MIKFEDFYKEYFCIKSPYEHQKGMWEEIHKNNSPLLLRAPTGSGKTEAVLAPYLSQFIENNFNIAPRLIYVLPMRVLVDTIAERIDKYVKKISSYISVEIQHGDVPNSPFFISDIVVTTLDQFFYGFVRSSMQVGRHIDMPAGSIASSLIVFDEAHMYRDGYTFSIMRALMEILYNSKIPFIVMTATMPVSLEKSIFEQIPLTDNQKLVGSTLMKNRLKISIEKESIFTNGNVNLSEEILEKIENKKTLIIVNQVKRAQEIYDEIKSKLRLNDEQIVLLHSRFTKDDRKEHEKKAISIIPHKEDGKITKLDGTQIVISTQVVEAGIDFSAELLLTEQAPADALVQRAGRCARYENEFGEMIIFPVENDKGYLPYKKEHLDNAFKWLNNNIMGFDIRNFDHVCNFVNETLDYQASNYEARDTLIDLYECVLYADERPKNIQLRDGKPITLVVVDLSKGKGRGKENQVKDALRKTNIRDNSINVDIGVGWKLLKDGILEYEINFDREKGEWYIRKITNIAPFSYYLLKNDCYCRLKGVIPDASTFI
jgi:CRISPR-associated endonuclease/helicase Cas3